MKQTAVEWLVEQFNEIHTQRKWKEITDQAKEMEKQNIINAYLDGNYDKGFGRCSEVKYYNTKFNK